ncbi:MAG: hypothetical protein KAT32_00520 [Candidatus Moranbacteria bacterium]|nr:hypothetical protein [Candidatus Moranbacteria bacterium]
MQWKFPENTDKYYWTEHAKLKMRHYGLSAQRVKRVLLRPMRTEEGIAEKTIAVMQPQSTRRDENGEKDWKSEIWVMYQIKSKKSKKGFRDVKVNNKLAEMLGGFKSEQISVISAWRYPGKTKVGEGLPEGILDEIGECEV